jgi:hypothetical protein
MAGQSTSNRPLDNAAANHAQVVAAAPASAFETQNRLATGTSPAQDGSASGNRLPAPNPLSAAAAQHTRVGVVDDWSQHHVIFPASKNAALTSRLQKDPRWTQEWFLHHRQTWWPKAPHGHLKSIPKMQGEQRDWSAPLGTASFEPIYDPGFTTADPGSGQTFPAKYTFDVTAAPTCANQPNTGDAGDYVAMGIPAAAQAGLGGQANIIGFNNLYTNPSGTGYCSGDGPTVLFAYASGSGEVPASVALSLDGTELAYIEDILPTGGNPDGAANFHVLTWVANEGTSATDPATPDSGNDLSLPLIPPETSIVQSSTSAPFIDYTTDSAYVTTYSWTTDTGYLYKISPVFTSTLTNPPAIVWAVETTAVTSSPVYDSLFSNVYMTDLGGHIEWVTDMGSSASAVTVSTQFTDAASSSLNPVVVDVTNSRVYATFANTRDGAVVVQASEGYTDGSPALTGSSTVFLGVETSAVSGPYNVDFNDYFYGPSASDTTETGSLMFVAAMDDTNGTIATLYTIPFLYGSQISTIGATSTALASAAADSSPVTEFYNDATGTDQLFVGVTDNCIATGGGGTGGCVMSFDITDTTFTYNMDDTGGTWTSPPTATTLTTAIAAQGGSSGLIIDNDADTNPLDTPNYPEASSVYYATKTGNTLVKATQSGLQ